jgi:hypothetical protein
MIRRNLFSIEMSPEPISEERINRIREKTSRVLGLDEHETNYYVYSDTTSNYAYDPFTARIMVLFKNGEIKDVSEASDQLNISVLSRPVTKYFVCYPKEIRDVDK